MRKAAAPVRIVTSYLGPIHFAHPAFTNFFENLIIRDGLADHRTPPC